MKKHKKYILIIGIIIILIGGTGGYYVWCAYHPEIDIQVTDFGKGDEYKIQMPSIVIAPRGTPKIASAVIIAYSPKFSASFSTSSGMVIPMASAVF